MRGRRRGETSRGFQLIELMIVVALAVLGVGFAGASIVRIASSHRLDFGVRTFVSELSSLRARAVTGNRPMSVQIDGTGTRYGFGSPGDLPRSWTQLPAGVRFRGQPLRPVTFYSRGSAVPAGSYLIENSAGTIKVIVAASGRIRWKYE